jgi:hypothetical protein
MTRFQKSRENMVSFLNGKSPFDEAEEKLEAGETINGRPKMPTGPIMGWQDGVFLLVIIGLIVGGYQYYQYAKKKSADVFASCDTLYQAAAVDPTKYVEVEACYDSTWDLGFVSDSMEVLRQNRQGQIADMRNAQKDILEDAKILLEDGDTAKAVASLKNYAGAKLLRPSDASEWNKIVALSVPEAKPESKPETPAE